MAYSEAAHQIKNAYRFSETMLNPKWDAATLDRFLAQPRKFVPQTTVLFQSITDPQDRADHIGYFKVATN